MQRLTYPWLLLCLCYAIVTAQNPPPAQQVVAVRLTGHVSIDGVLSEEFWQRPGYTGLVQQEPDEGVEPSQRSEVWIAYDDGALYFAARYADTHPDSIMARLVRRDFIWGDPSDGCVLYLDSYRDRRSGYFFYVSAAGALADGLIENDVKQPNDLSWDAVWEGAAGIDAGGWSVEMRIPYSQLRFDEGNSPVWGINVERFISRRAETDMIVYTPRNESGFASRFLDLVGMEGGMPSARTEVMPYVTSKAEYVGNDPADPFNPGKRFLFGGGVDIRAGLGSSLTLNGTINPDFGQVEVDPAIVNLTDVEYSFEEKRPFFTEGVNIYRFGQGGANNRVMFNWQHPEIFYSRRIGRAPQGSVPPSDYAEAPTGTHILAAGKISGRILDEWKVGMVHAITQREFARIDNGGQRTQVETEPLTYYGILRTQRDFDEGRQGVGLLATFTNRFFGDPSLRTAVSSSAVVAAGDGWTFLDAEKTYVLSGWAGLSRVNGSQSRMIALQRSSGHYFQRPDVSYLGVDSSATSLTGYAGRLMINKNRGRWTMNAAFGLLSPRFEVNDLGYAPYSDLMNAHFFTGYRWNTPTAYYLNAGINAATFASWDFGGNNTLRGYWLGSYITLPTLYGANFTLQYNPESYNARATRGGPLMLNPIARTYNLILYTDNRLWWVLNLVGFARTGENQESRSVTTNVEVKVTPTLTLSVGPQFSRDKYGAQWVSALPDPTAPDTYGKRYVFAHLDQTTFAADIRIDWIINPKLSFQVYLQPLISSGKYTDFKALVRPKSYTFMKYGEDGSTIVPVTSETGEVLGYELDPDGQGPAAAATIGNPDFNILSLRGNAVLRWEYLPGSSLYLVWTQSRSDYEPGGEFEFKHSMSHLFTVTPDNIFMLKLSYWWGGVL